MRLFLLVAVFYCRVNVGRGDSCLGVYNGLVYKFNKGDSWSNIGKCILHRCKGDNQVAVERCPPVTLQEGCTFSGGDLTKHFPGCCRYPICKETEPVFCVDKHDLSTHRPGEEWQPSGRCVHKECVGGGLTLISKCPVHELPAGCYYTEVDLRQSFPKCCPKVVCESQREDED